MNDTTDNADDRRMERRLASLKIETTPELDARILGAAEAASRSRSRRPEPAGTWGRAVRFARSRRVQAIAACLALAAGLAAVLAMVLTLGSPAPATAAEMRVIGYLTDDELASPEKKMARLEGDVGQGALRVAMADGRLAECPLRHTDVKAEISGFVARVKVTQTFFNPLSEKIEAVYVFPLPHQSAVDDMTMVLSSGRRIVGVIKRRAEARQIYEQAVAQGATAALLEQERPNIFTQSVGNIDPQEEIRIEISYVDVLRYDAGTYEFEFPMVVGPRYIPGGATSAVPPVPPELSGKVGEAVPPGGGGPAAPSGTGWSPDTDRVPDASRITPPVLKPEFRNGHDISLSVSLDAGVPIQDIGMMNHKGTIERKGQARAAVAIDETDSIPNKDFRLRYGVVGEKPSMAVLTHAAPGAGGGYFLLMIQPKLDAQLKAAPPREIVFLVDVSGSMSGQPVAKVREAMSALLKLCKPEDTVQVITFESVAHKHFPKALPATPETITRALAFTEGFQGGGGTEMLKGIQMAINDPLDGKRVRMVVMLTDGFIGNESEIIAEVGRRCGDQIRFWCIGIGSSPNMMLVDGVARQGGGMGKVLTLEENSQPLTEEMMMRIHRAQLANIQIDWGKARVEETFPAKVPELWAERPVILVGRYRGSAEDATVTVRGTVEGEPADWPLKVSFPAEEPDNDVLAKVWARRKIEELEQSAYYGHAPAVEEAVTRLALDYRLMSQYTSFVAVDQTELDATKQVAARPPRRMLVPVPIPAGTRFEGFFGDETRPVVWARAGDFDDTAEVPLLGDVPRMKFINGTALEVADALEFTITNGPDATLTPPPGRPASGSLHTTYSYVSTRDLKETEESAVPWSGLYRYPSADEWKSLTPERARFTKGEVIKEILPVTLADGQHDLNFAGNANGRVWAWDGVAYDIRAGDSLSRGVPVSTWWITIGGEQVEAVSKQAQAALAEAEMLSGEGKAAEARSRFAWACLLDNAATGGAMSEVGGKALSQIDAIDAQQRKAWVAAIPGLTHKVDMIVRNQSLEEAAEAVGRAAGFGVRFVPGSIEDAESVASGSSQVTWLDLRGATGEEALDWLLRPARLQWQVEQGAVVVTSARRDGVAAAWSYNVGTLAVPTAEELKPIEDQQKRVEAVTKAMDGFAVAVRTSLGLTEQQASWGTLGRLIVFADRATHERVAALMKALADPQGEVDAPLAELHKLTSARAAERKDAMTKAAEAIAIRQTLAGLASPSWTLLSAAAGGELNLEALTRLQAAWRSAAMDRVLADESLRGIALRSAWALHESSLALPKEKELAALARESLQRTRAAAEAAAQAMDKLPQDAATVLGAAYACLAWRGDDELSGKLLASLEKAGGQWSQIRSLVAPLVKPAAALDPAALSALLKTPLQGDDANVLLAMACRRTGRDTWETWRATAAERLGRQVLSGDVVVLTSRLASTDLPIVSATAP